MQHGVAAVSERRRLQLHHRPGRALRFEELEGEAPLHRNGRHRLHPLQRLEPALGLPRLARLVAETVDERLDPRTLAPLAVGGPARVRDLDGAQPFERAVVPGVEGDPATDDQGNVVHDGIEELPVVGDEQQGPGVAPQPAFQPDHRIEVEVVRGLVEQEEVRGGDEGAGERGAHPPAPGEGVQTPRPVVRREAEPAQDAARGGFRGVAVDGFQIGVRRRLGRGVPARAGIREPGADRRDARIAGDHVVDEGDVAARRFLGHRRHRDAGGQLDFAPIRLQLAEQQREEAGLAGAVRPHHPDLPPAPDRQVRVPEHPRPAAAQLDAVEPDHGMRSAGKMIQAPAASLAGSPSVARSRPPANARSSSHRTNPTSELYAARSSRR